MTQGTAACLAASVTPIASLTLVMVKAETQSTFSSRKMLICQA
jgi:hypothetical protein